MTRIKTYRGWEIYYEHSHRPLWLATKGMEKDVFSFQSIEQLERHIDRKESLAGVNYSKGITTMGGTRDCRK